MNCPEHPTHPGPCTRAIDGDAEPLGYCTVCYRDMEQPMTAQRPTLHARISAALDHQHVRAESLRSRSPGHSARLMRVVESDRRVLARHGARPVHLSTSRSQPICTHCDLTASPCPDLLDLATRVDVQP